MESQEEVVLSVSCCIREIVSISKYAPGRGRDERSALKDSTELSVTKREGERDNTNKQLLQTGADRAGWACRQLTG